MASRKPQKQRKSSTRSKASDSRAAEAAREAARHTKIRKDHAQEIAEDYVELIANLASLRGEARTVEIAERLGVSHVTVTKTVRRLAQAGLVTTEPYRSIFLTDSGKEMAVRSADRHKLVVEFLRKLGVDGQAAEQDAEGIEHHVSEQTMSAIRRFMGK